jgi:cell fate regulator YaaT (PSP1 superfamily)
MEHLEYLLSYGLVGDFGRFRGIRPLVCRRGDRAIVRSHRGLEIAEVLREATPEHAHFLPNTTVGQLLRLVTPEDERTAERMHERAQRLFERATRLAAELALPLEVLDGEVLFDGEHAVLHHLSGASCDVRPFVSSLSREFEMHIALTDLTRGQGIQEPEEAEELGCGREGCGKGQCGSCGTGGCSTCGVARPQEVTAYFAQLREKMAQGRTSLL